MKRILFIITLLLITNCKTDIVKNEKLAIEEINTTMLASSSVKDKISEKGKSKIIKVFDSKLINDLIDVATIPASNVAYIYYKHMKEFLDNYESIIVEIYVDNEQYFKPLNYPLKHLSEFQKVIDTLGFVVKKMDNNDFEWFTNNHTYYLSKRKSSEFERIFASRNKEYGKVKEIEFMGCSHYKSNYDSGFNRVGVSAFLIRENGKHPIQIHFIKDSMKIDGIQFTF